MPIDTTRTTPSQSFKLHPKLEQDSLLIGRTETNIQVRLLNAAELPWILLIPETSITDIFELSQEEQTALHEATSRAAAWIKSLPQTTKINVASIGNVVPQLHVHLVGRNPKDAFWPNVVWGQNTTPYSQKASQALIKQAQDFLGLQI